jgi:hypothetical protein
MASHRLHLGIFVTSIFFNARFDLIYSNSDPDNFESFFNFRHLGLAIISLEQWVRTLPTFLALGLAIIGLGFISIYLCFGF